MLPRPRNDQRAARIDHDLGEHCAAEARELAVSHPLALLSCSVPDRVRCRPERVFVSSGPSGLDHRGCRSAPGPFAVSIIASGRFYGPFRIQAIQTVAAFAPTAGARERLDRFDRGLKTHNLPELGLTV